MSGTDAVVENVDNGKSLRYGLLVPAMVERYGFYEGRGTTYRLEPSDVVAVFDFLKQKKGKGEEGKRGGESLSFLLPELPVAAFFSYNTGDGAPFIRV
jgi:hypothetical protein